MEFMENTTITLTYFAAFMSHCKFKYRDVILSLHWSLMSINFHPDSLNVALFIIGFFAISLLPKNYCFYIFHGNSSKYMKIPTSILLLYMQERGTDPSIRKKNSNSIIPKHSLLRGFKIFKILPSSFPNFLSMNSSTK